MKSLLTRLAIGVRMPNLLILGAQKGGTSALHECLGAHPEVFMTLEKELHYFYSDGRRLSGDVPVRPLNRRWLRACFDHEKARGAKWCGESTPYYLFHPLVPARVARELPRVRCIVLLRDPVERAFSHYRMMRRFEREGQSRRWGCEDAETFGEAIARESQRLAGEEEKLLADPQYWSLEHMHHSYLARGFYHAQLTRWLRVLPEDRFLVIRSEIFFDDPARALGSVAAFLGIENCFVRPPQAVNAGDPGSMDPALRSQLDARFADDQRQLDALVRRLPHHCW
jgi:hypothetical protein